MNNAVFRLAAGLLLIVLGRTSLDFISGHNAEVLSEVPTDAFGNWQLTLGDWVGTPVDIDDELFGKTGANIMNNWLYRAGNGNSVLLSLGLWNKYDIVLPHSPDSCYPAAGWQEVEKEDLSIACQNGTTIPARLVTYVRKSERILVLFWFRFGDDILLDSPEVRMLKQRLRREGRENPLAIKVLMQADASPSESAKSRLLELAALVGPRVASIH